MKGEKGFMRVSEKKFLNKESHINVESESKYLLHQEVDSLLEVYSKKEILDAVESYLQSNKVS